jgi:hypothetical protein
MTLAAFLAIDPDYRTVTGGDFSPEPTRRRCAVLELDHGTGETILETVWITDGYRAKLTRETREGFYVANLEAWTHEDQAPSFLVTGEHWRSVTDYANGWEHGGAHVAGGWMPETLAAVFPELAPILLVSGSDVVTGEPLYPVQNGWYHYREGNYDAAARLLRVPLSDLPTGLPDGEPMTESEFRSFAYAQRERWKAEASAALALLRELSEREPEPAPEPGHGITLRILSGPKVIESDGRAERSWKLTLTRGDFTMPVPFYQGMLHTEPPTVADVLECVLSDAASYEQAGGVFEDWAPDFGYDPDDKRARKVFDDVGKQTAELRHLFGEDFERFVFPPLDESDPYADGYERVISELTEGGSDE